jgi:hypothetical protein
MLKDHQNSHILETKILWSTFPLLKQGYKTPKTSRRNFNVLLKEKDLLHHRKKYFKIVPKFIFQEGLISSEENKPQSIKIIEDFISKSQEKHFPKKLF